MANGVDKRGLRRPEASRALPFVAIAFVTALLLTPFLWVSWLSVHQQHLYAQGQVLAARIVTDHAVGGFYGGRIYYRVEAQVRFSAEGALQDRWMRASDVTDDRESLLLKLARQPKNCTVIWVPGHLEHAQCNLP